MKKAIIAWLFSLLSGEEQKEITNDMLKVTYPEHHLRHNPRKKTDENNRRGVRGDDVAGSKAIALPLTEAQVQSKAV